MVSFPHAKINLGLDIIRKRPDGYHDLETCFYPVPWTDILEIIPAQEFKFSASGLSVSGPTENNLCVKAYWLLQKDFGLPTVHIHLHKIIPMGAGLGGGSADGAFTLRQLNESYSLGLSVESLQQYAAKLGSDCAFFVSDQPQIGRGRGEILEPLQLSLKGKFLLIVKPNVHVSTADAFAGIIPTPSKVNLSEVLMLPVKEWRDVLKNDFEETVFRKHPVIREVKEKLYAMGAEYASMSGSGSSVFGIFDKIVETDGFQGMSVFGSAVA